MKRIAQWIYALAALLVGALVWALAEAAGVL